jgi:DNA-binding winged helix-turn-helix (wHTH) protein/TolB-like protein
MAVVASTMQTEQRTPLEPSSPFRVGDWLVNPQLDEIARGGEVIKLEPRMVRLLCRLAELPGQVVSTQQLLDSVWTGVIVGPASVYQAVSQLRKLLGDTGATPTYIATVSRKGYRLVASVALADGAAVAPHTSQSTVPLSAPTDRVGVNPQIWRWALGAIALVAIASATFLWSRSERATVASPAFATASAALNPPIIALAPFQSTVSGDDSRIFALSVRELLHNRLMTQHELWVSSLESANALAKSGTDAREYARKLGANFVLRGTAAHLADRLQVEVELFDMTSGEQLWSTRFDRAPGELTAIREEIVLRIGRTLRVHIDDVGDVPVEFDAQQHFMRGQESLTQLTTEKIQEAREVFQRTTVLYPNFARGYFGLGQALMLQQNPDAAHAFDRALELDPDFGEALNERAAQNTDMPGGVNTDSAKSETMFRRGLELVPSYDLGYFKYAQFLLNSRRAGEAINVLDRGLRVDPLSVILLMLKAEVLLVSRSDIAGHDRLMRQLLEIKPGFFLALEGLARSNYAFNGATADAIRDAERLLALDPAQLRVRHTAAAAYLDVDDPAAAAKVGGENPLTLLEIAQFRHQPTHVSALPEGMKIRGWLLWENLPFSPLAEAVRDEAIVSGNFADAIKVLEAPHSVPNEPPAFFRGPELVYAHTLTLSGDTKRGRELALSLLKQFDLDEVGRPPHWYARERASAYAILGDYERALAELAESQQHNNFTRWWYTAELDPLFAPLRKDPRFQKLAEAAKNHRAEQRALLEEMRRKGEIPRRPA